MSGAMVEVRWHGRGGQGAVTAAKILAQAAYLSGWESVTAAPSFGAERRGAPVTASTRMAHEQIRVLSQVTAPDVVVVLDDSLLSAVDVAAGLKPGGVVILNTVEPTLALQAPQGARVVRADVTGAAQAAGVVVGGQPIVNTAILGAFAAATGLVTLSAVEEAIAATFSGSAAARNVEAARLAYECVQV
ncbi:MAG: 2-oxoacid:acceptor oxidoreductase family protein [Anaerosomatales bacterium]|nr:2-oxoacid:acceptor oxidoreductase family protein [Anaerosomatales bacterium]